MSIGVRVLYSILLKEQHHINDTHFRRPVSWTQSRLIDASYALLWTKILLW